MKQYFAAVMPKESFLFDRTTLNYFSISLYASILEVLALKSVPEPTIRNEDKIS